MSPHRRLTPSPDDIRKSGLKALRTELDLHQRDCAEKVTTGGVAIKRSTWDAWERRERPVTMTQLLAIKKGFDLSSSQVLAIIDWWGSPVADAA